MKELLSRSFAFIRENPRIIYSLVLVFLIPLAIFFNTYFILDKFKKNVNQLTQRQAILGESIISLIAQNSLADAEKLNETLLKIKAANDDVEYLRVFDYVPEKQTFTAIASTNREEIKQELSENQRIQNILAWNDPRGIAYLDSNEKGRFWNVTKSFANDAGEQLGLISLSLSLRQSDKIIAETARNSYLILILTIAIVLLMVANNARLFGYALTLAKLKEVDKMKDTFISMASHELKSPLISMKGNIEFFREEMESHLNENGKHYIENIYNSAERLEMLIGDILEVSRLEGNRIPISENVVNLVPIIKKSIEEIKPQAIQKGIAVSYEASKLPPIRTDPERVKQIVINLLSNAVKYTLKGQVQIITKTTDKELLITVADTGVGISAENLANLFQKFSRIFNKETREASGTGLGLWISRELARKMKGDITVESIRGVGSHFTLRLPLAR